VLPETNRSGASGIGAGGQAVGLRIVEYSEDMNSVTEIPVTHYENSSRDEALKEVEIWSLSPHPGNPNLVFIVGSTPLKRNKDSGSFQHWAKLCRLRFTESSDANDSPSFDSEHGESISWKCSVEVVKTLDFDESKHGRVSEIHWAPTEEVLYDDPGDLLEDTNQEDLDFDEGERFSYRGSQVIVSVHSKSILCWDLSVPETSFTIVAAKTDVQTENRSFVFSGSSWDPHHPSELAVGYGTSIEVYNVEEPTGEPIRSIPVADSSMVRQVDYNPNKPYFILSGGDDGTIKFWDLRKPSLPVQIIAGHSLWVTQVKYNKSHDQLIISSGTDGVVSLWRMSSISSAPLLDFLAEDEGSNDAIPLNESDSDDALIKKNEEHTDSIYGAVWSRNDAWVFASVSYDGRLCIGHVPSAEKYKILL